jgi:hypothetical protein
MPHTKKFTIVLDLDNTCICAIEMDKLDSVANPEWYVGQNKPVDLEDIYRIYPRPHLQEFLDRIFNDYYVAVWTAADLDYALFVIDNFITPSDKPGRELQFIMWGEHCEYSRKHTSDNQAKQLTLLSLPMDNPLYDVNNTVLIDDNEDVLRQTQDTIDSLYFDVTKHDAIHDTFFPHTCVDNIILHFNEQQRRVNKFNMMKDIRQRLLPLPIC